VFPQVASGPAYAALRREQRFAKADPAFGESLVRSPVQSPITALSAVAAAKADHYSRRTQRERASAFTLIELLVVIGIIGLLMVLLVPAFTSLRGGTDVTSAAYTIKGVLDTARTYAKANNTYTWVGFYEENSTATTPTNNAPAYPGKGRVLLATVGSKDATKIYQDTDPAAALPSDRISQVGKLVKVEGIHLTDIGNPSPTPNPTPVPDTVPARPYTPYTEGSPFDNFNRISSDSTDTTRFTFTAQNYTFYKTIRFSPRGEANINSTYALKHEGEIGIKPTHGTAVDTNSPNVVAIQFGGLGGDVKVYRR
jgi:prepilin-type N-terminal cleavage/methylation domain-containing protein